MIDAKFVEFIELKRKKVKGFRIKNKGYRISDSRRKVGGIRCRGKIRVCILFSFQAYCLQASRLPSLVDLPA